MKKRTSRVLIALMATAALALGGVTTASAKNGADDPPGHISGGHGVDDTAQGQTTAGDHGGQRHHGKKGHKHHRGHGRHGAHHGPNHT